MSDVVKSVKDRISGNFYQLLFYSRFKAVEQKLPPLVVMGRKIILIFLSTLSLCIAYAPNIHDLGCNNA